MAHLGIEFTLNINVNRDENIERLRREVYLSKPLDVEVINTLCAEAQDGSISARDKIVSANLRICWSTAARYSQYGDFNDLYQEAVIGLIEAISKYNPTIGIAFTTFSVIYMRRAITNYLTTSTGVVRINGRIRREGKHYSQASMDAPMDGDNEDGGKTYGETFSSDSRADKELEDEERLLRIKKAISRLKEREQKVVLGLFLGDETEYTLSIELGMTEERIRQIKHEALGKLRELL